MSSGIAMFPSGFATNSLTYSLEILQVIKKNRTKIQQHLQFSHMNQKGLYNRFEKLKYLAVLVGWESPYLMLVLSYSGRDICRDKKQCCPISRSTIQTHSFNIYIYIYVYVCVLLLHSHMDMLEAAEELLLVQH